MSKLNFFSLLFMFSFSLLLSSCISLTTAVKSSDVAKTQALLNKGEDPNILEKNTGNPLLNIAVKQGNSELVLSLIKAGANVNKRNNRTETALMLASQLGYADIVKILLENGADPNAQKEFDIQDDMDKLGFTPLIFATYYGQYDCVKKLLDGGAKINLRSKKQVSADINMSGTQNGRTTTFRTSGLKKEVPDKTALSWARERGLSEIAKLLQEYGAKE